jgi:SAM-dependent methyltransferase
MLKKYYKKIEVSNLQLREHENFCDTVIDISWSKIEYNRIAFINKAVQNFKECKYLEIGCENNLCFHSVAAKDKIGIDPVSGGNMKITSDDFFKNNTIIFDVIFIDGLHTYEQVRKDVVNSLRFLKNGGFIFLHDMIPRSFLEEHVSRLQNIWTGNVWKVGIELAKTNNIDFYVINADHGVGVLKKKQDTQLYDDYINLKDLKFKDFLYLNEIINYINPEEAIKIINKSIGQAI